jgi:hypothetical protein
MTTASNIAYTYIAASAGTSGSTGPANFAVASGPTGTALSANAACVQSDGTVCASTLGAGLVDGTVDWISVEPTPVNAQPAWASGHAYGVGAYVSNGGNIFVALSGGTSGSTAPACTAVWTTGILTSGHPSVSGIPSTSAMTNGQLAASTTGYIPAGTTITVVDSSDITLSQNATGGDGISNVNLVVGSTSCSDGALNWALVSPGVANGVGANNGLIQPDSFTAFILEASSDVTANVVAQQAAYGVKLFPRGSNDSTIRRANIHFAGTVQNACLTDTPPSGTWQAQTVGYVDGLTLDHWDCRTNGIEDGAIMLGRSTYGGSPLVNSSVNYTNLLIDGGQFINPKYYALYTNLTYTSGMTPSVIQGRISGGARFVGCEGGLYIDNNFQMAVSAGNWFETSCPGVSGIHTPIYFGSATPTTPVQTASGYIALMGPNTVVTAITLGNSNASNQDLIDGWGPYPGEMSGSITLSATPVGTATYCGTTGTVLAVCGGPLVRGTSPSTPSTGTGNAACNYGDLWMTQQTSAAAPTGYSCTTEGSPGVWTPH